MPEEIGIMLAVLLLIVIGMLLGVSAIDKRLEADKGIFLECVEKIQEIEWCYNQIILN